MRGHIKTKANSSNSHTAALVQSQKHHTVHSNASEFLALKIKDELEHHHFKGLAMNKCTACMVFSQSHTRWCYGQDSLILITSRPVGSRHCLCLVPLFSLSIVKLCSHLVEKSELTKSINASCAVLLFLGALQMQ